MALLFLVAVEHSYPNMSVPLPPKISAILERDKTEVTASNTSFRDNTNSNGLNKPLYGRNCAAQAAIGNPTNSTFVSNTSVSIFNCSTWQIGYSGAKTLKLVCTASKTSLS